jgi:hypothetical protein
MIDMKLLEIIRSRGWQVAVHNDYRMGGQDMTFWGFSRGDEWVRGEGKTDGEALHSVLEQIDGRPRIYVAGPYRAATQLEVDRNIERAEHLGQLVSRMGGVPVIPHSMYRYCREMTDEIVIEATLSLLHACQAMVVNLPHEMVVGSVGTMGEIEDCHRHKRPIFYDDVDSANDDDLVALKIWIAGRRVLRRVVNSSLYGKFGG